MMPDSQTSVLYTWFFNWLLGVEQNRVNSPVMKNICPHFYTQGRAMYSSRCSITAFFVTDLENLKIFGLAIAIEKLFRNIN